MTKNLKYYLSIILIGLISACQNFEGFNEPITTSNTKIVVNGILVSGEKPVITLTELVEFNDTVQIPITEAIVSIIYNDQKYNLELSNENLGEYSYNKDDLEVLTGKTYFLEVEHQSTVLYAKTIIPYPPAHFEIEIDSTENFDSLNYISHNYLEVQWQSLDSNYFYPVLECDSLNEPFENYCSQYFDDRYPFQYNYTKFQTDDFVTYGIYKLTIYSITEEYVQYYYDYNPISSYRYIGNIENAYGIFTGLSSNSITFQYFTDSLALIPIN